ncbi:MAG: OmpA family protein [Alphaproteobacteria bacterium]
MKKIAVIFGICTLTACVRTPTNIDDDQVYFAFDSAEITRDTRSGLDAQARYMKRNPDVNVVLGGHCDERGSTEYNLALGALRAGNAAQVLIKDGIESKRIKTISYGKENPQYKGTGEKVWAKNRNVTTDIAK